jgi:uncharacterized protein (TIGR02246 family)
MAALLSVIGSFPAGAATNMQSGRTGSDERGAAVRVIDTVVHAWNRNDAGTIAQLFEPNGVLVMPTGSVLRSRSAIRKRITDERQGKLKDTTLRHRVENVSISGDTAVIKGKYQLDGMSVLGIKASPEGSFTFRQNKRRGRWSVSRAEIGK